MPWIKTVPKKHTPHSCKQPKGWALSRKEFGSIWQCPKCNRKYEYAELDYSKTGDGLPLLATEDYRWLLLDEDDVLDR